MCIVRWYKTMTLRTWPVLVHYIIVVNPYRPIRAVCGALEEGSKVRHVEDLLATVEEHTVGELVRVTVSRGGKAVDLKIRLSELGAAKL